MIEMKNYWPENYFYWPLNYWHIFHNSVVTLSCEGQVYFSCEVDEVNALSGEVECESALETTV